jgi:hypothetical protein
MTQSVLTHESLHLLVFVKIIDGMDIATYRSVDIGQDGCCKQETIWSQRVLQFPNESCVFITMLLCLLILVAACEAKCLLEAMP